MTNRANISLCVVFVCMLLGSCGFQLRGTGGQDFQIASIHIAIANVYRELAQVIETTLANAGTEIISSADQAPWTANVLSERFSRRVASTSREVSVAKYELTLEVQFSLIEQSGLQLIPATLLTVERLYDYDPANLVGSDAEEQLLMQEMRMEVAESLVRRIGVTINHQAPR